MSNIVARLQEAQRFSSAERSARRQGKIQLRNAARRLVEEEDFAETHSVIRIREIEGCIDKNQRGIPGGDIVFAGQPRISVFCEF